jgi:hypothetical protein
MSEKKDTQLKGAHKAVKQKFEEIGEICSEHKDDMSLILISSDGNFTNLSLFGTSFNIINMLANALATNDPLVDFIEEATLLVLVNGISKQVEENGMTMDEALAESDLGDKEKEMVKALLSTNEVKTEA